MNTYDPWELREWASGGFWLRKKPDYGGITSPKREGWTMQQIVEHRWKVFNSLTPYINPAKRLAPFWRTRLGRVLFPIWRLCGGGPRRPVMVMHEQTETV